jgi:hypothetical protein
MYVPTFSKQSSLFTVTHIGKLNIVLDSGCSITTCTNFTRISALMMTALMQLSAWKLQKQWENL